MKKSKNIKEQFCKISTELLLISSIINADIPSMLATPFYKPYDLSLITGNTEDKIQNDAKNISQKNTSSVIPINEYIKTKKKKQIGRHHDI